MGAEGRFLSSHRTAEKHKPSSAPLGVIQELYPNDKHNDKEKHMGRRSSGQDRREGAMDKAKGRMKEAVGSLTGNKGQKREGRSDQRKGKFGEMKGKLKNLFK
jgi:uncharacterized protein YjbJ (UPF0337 family)